MKDILRRWFSFTWSPKGTQQEISMEIQSPADFETAIVATSFGKFNILILLLAMISGWAYVFEATNLGFIISVADRDLGLSLELKGYLLGSTYGGMVISSLFWGYLSDTIGRKKLMVIGYTLGTLFALLSGISQSIGTLMFAKFMGGFIQTGPMAILTTALSEFHCARFRAKIVLYIGITISVASIFLPVVAMVLLPKTINLQLFNGYIILRSWNIFLIVCGLPSTISAIGHLFVPESPKFLMTSGRNDEALKVFQKVYSVNTGKDPETFPIKELIDETKSETRNTISPDKMKAFKNGLTQLKPLFMKPHLMKMILVSFIQISTVLSLNSFRLWLPQLFSAISDFEASSHNDESNICAMIESLTSNHNKTIESTSNTATYTNVMIVYIVTVIGFLVFTALVNKCGKKALYVGSALSGGLLAFLIYFSRTSLVVTALSSLSVALLGISSHLLISVLVDLFPTTLRTMAVSVILSFGRLGTIVGNILFPYLIITGCMAPFLFLALMMLVSAILALFLPKTDLKPLE